jgi:hypothetical protein
VLNDCIWVCFQTQLDILATALPSVKNFFSLFEDFPGRPRKAASEWFVPKRNHLGTVPEWLRQDVGARVQSSHGDDRRYS